MKKIIVTILIWSITTLGFAGGYGKGNQGVQSDWAEGKGQNSPLCWTSLPIEELSDLEQDALRYMIEEEKLARDVYSELFETWGLRVFQNISMSEQRHMDAIGALFDRYEMENPVIGQDAGYFEDSALQDLYELLVEKGGITMIDALHVGATIEDLDIYDLQEKLSETNNEDLTLVFENLMKGSRNHLRAFVSLLESQGDEYVAQYLTQEEVDAIVASDRERGH